MLKKIIVIYLFMLFGLFGMAQSTINNYKYVVVPLKFDFLSENDQYRLNTLTRHLFKQNGFTVFYSKEEFPEDLVKDNCIALYADVKKVKGGFLKTKIEILLNDCFSKEVFKSEVGTSREKDYKEAYSAALREGFKSIEQLNYKYQPIEEEAEEAKTTEDEAVKEEEAIKEEINKEPLKEKVKSYKDLYYAQAIENGYNLVNTEPKIIMTILSTSANNVYLVEGKRAIVYKEDGFWYLSENNGELKEKILLNIKF
jgi:hypothetical protein